MVASDDGCELEKLEEETGKGFNNRRSEIRTQNSPVERKKQLLRVPRLPSRTAAAGGQISATTHRYAKYPAATHSDARTAQRAVGSRRSGAVVPKT
jgi:hypothetical protein